MYYLMNKDNALMSFEIGSDCGEEYCYNEQVYGELPFWVKDINTWLSNRSSAKHRKHIKKILVECGAESISGFIALTHCLSVNDTLWVKSDNECVNWDMVSLYCNEFDEVIARLSFDGSGMFGDTLSVTSPELTTDGAFDKCWLFNDGDISLIKVGSSGASNAGMESYSEVVASQVYNALTDDSVKYCLRKYHKRVVSECRLFTSERYGFKSAASCGISSVPIPLLLKEMEKYGSEDTFRRMIVGDAVTINCDRHLGNFGFLIDNDTFEKVRMAPIFDYNLAMFPYADWYEGFPDMEAWIEERGPRLGTNYYTAVNSVMTSRIRADLINLKDYTLELECDSKFDRQRLDICNRFKNLQIDKLLGNRVQFDFTDIRRKYEESVSGGGHLSRLAGRK